MTPAELAAKADYLKKTDNGNGTFNLVLIHTKFTQDGANAFVNLTNYIVVQRSFVASPEPGGLAVKSDGGSGYVIAPMLLDNSLSSEDEAVLLQKANQVLSTSIFNKSKLDAYYNTSTGNVVVNSKDISGNYNIYDIMGRSISKGVIASEISVQNLVSGIYFLTTDQGILKFAK